MITEVEEPLQPDVHCVAFFLPNAPQHRPAQRQITRQSDGPALRARHQHLGIKSPPRP